MKKTTLFGGILPLLGLLIPAAQAENIKLTADMLYQGTTIPLRREFPLSTEVKACDNFYAYVCSEAQKKFTLPEDRSRWAFAFSDNAERILYAKKQYFKFLEKGYEPVAGHAKPVKNYYLACMNDKASSEEEKSIVKKELEQFNKISTYEDLLKLSISRYKTGMKVLLTYGQEANLDDPLHYDAIPMTRFRSLPEKTYYEDAKVTAALKKVFVKFFETLGFPDADQRAQWVLDFEKGFAKASPLPSEMRKRYTERNYMERAEWLKSYPDLGLKEMFALFPKKTKVRNMIPETFTYLQGAHSLPIEQLKSVYLFHSLSPFMDDAYPEYFKTLFDFQASNLGGPKVRSDRQERCTKEAMSSFAMEIDEDLIPVLFPNFPADKVVKLVDKIRATITDKLDHSEWLSKEGKASAKKKIQKADLSLVKPKTEDQWNFNPVLKYSDKTPYENRLNLAAAVKAKDLKEMPEKRHRDRWDMGPLVLNAYYSAEDNKFVLLQGILQYPFFTDNDVQNLGAIGVVIGHELGHSIDDNGAKFDYTGKLHQWMTTADIENFKKRGGQFVERFNKAGQNGQLTLGENIGDHVGITTAYQAAFSNKTDAPAADKKTFFESYAKLWCDVIRPDYEKMMIKTNPHPSDRERVNQQVIHVDGFSEVYGCKTGDKMFVPKEERIHVW